MSRSCSNKVIMFSPNAKIKQPQKRERNHRVRSWEREYLSKVTIDFDDDFDDCPAHPKRDWDYGANTLHYGELQNRYGYTTDIKEIFK